MHPSTDTARAQPDTSRRRRPSADLPHQRLEDRARRLEQVVGALQERVRARADDAGDAKVPAPLLHAVDGFETELRSVRAELRRREDRDERELLTAV